jgi:PST family polysaccharide transporter
LYGLFAAALAFQLTLVIVGDGGIGLALIQREEPPSDEELASLFTLQLLLFILVAAGVWVLAEQIVNWVNIGVESVWVIRSMAMALIITSLRTIPAMLLERSLQFDAIALAEVVGTVLYQAVLLMLVWFGMGLMSITWALLARYFVDLCIIWYNHPWRPRWSLRFQVIMPYLRFGLNMQIVRVLAYAKDHLPLLILVPFLGATSAGYWAWSLTYIGIPVYFNRLVDRVMFPAYARLQSNQQAMGELVALTLWLNMAIGLPVLFVLIVFAEQLILLLYGATWLAAIPLLVLLTPNMFGGFITSSLFLALYGTGRSGEAARVFAVWIVLTFIGVVLALVVRNLESLALAYSIATLAIALFLIWMVYQRYPFKVVNSFLGPCLALVAAIFAFILLNSIHIIWFAIVLMAMGVYGGVLLIVNKQQVFEFVRDLRQLR